jgi:PAS domain S-box-containing protein
MPSSQLLNLAIEYANDAIMVFSDEGEIRFWNKGAKIIFGYKPEEIIGQNLEKLFKSDDAVSMLEHSEVLYNSVLHAKHQANHQIIVSATLTPVNTDKTFFLLICRDITNQHRFEEELTLKYQKLKEAYNEFGILRRQTDYIFDLLTLCEDEKDEQTIGDYIVTSVIMLTQADACNLRKYNKRKNSMDLVSSFGVTNDWQGNASIKFPGSLAEKAFKQNTPLRILDVLSEPLYQSKSLAQKHNLSSLLEIPLVFRNQPVGTLALYLRANKKLEIFENDFIEKYAKLISLIMATSFKH